MNHPEKCVFSARLGAVLVTAVLFLGNCLLCAQPREAERLPSRIKTSLNAYSFNSPLANGSMDLDGLLEFCASEGFDAVDITAYYFPGYPEVPPDDYLYRIKRKAFLLGLEISGTGVRNDFTDPDINSRREGIRLVKEWIIAAEKLGAPVIRIFAGSGDHQGYTREAVTEWLAGDVRECAEFGREHGVIVAVQNHNEFILNAGQAVELMKKIDSDWSGIILDTGSFREGDPYLQIEQTIPFAVSWQVKELIWIEGESRKIELVRLFKIIKKSGYRGYIPIETLGEGDPAVKVHDFLLEVREALEEVYSY